MRVRNTNQLLYCSSAPFPPLLLAEIHHLWDSIKKTIDGKAVGLEGPAEADYLTKMKLDVQNRDTLQQLYYHLQSKSVGFAEKVLSRDEARLLKNDLSVNDLYQMIESVKALQKIHSTIQMVAEVSIVHYKSMARIEPGYYLLKRMHFLYGANKVCLFDVLTALATASEVNFESTGDVKGPEQLTKGLLMAAFDAESKLNRLKIMARAEEANLPNLAPVEGPEMNVREQLKQASEEHTRLSFYAREADSMYTPNKNFFEIVNDIISFLYTDKEVLFSDRTVSLRCVRRLTLESASALELATTLAAKLAFPEEKHQGQMAPECVAAIVDFVCEFSDEQFGHEDWNVDAANIKEAIIKAMSQLRS